MLNLGSSAAKAAAQRRAAPAHTLRLLRRYYPLAAVGRHVVLLDPWAERPVLVSAALADRLFPHGLRAAQSAEAASSPRRTEQLHAELEGLTPIVQSMQDVQPDTRFPAYRRLLLQDGARAPICFIRRIFRAWHAKLAPQRCGLEFRFTSAEQAERSGAILSLVAADLPASHRDLVRVVYQGDAVRAAPVEAAPSGLPLVLALGTEAEAAPAALARLGRRVLPSCSEGLVPILRLTTACPGLSLTEQWNAVMDAGFARAEFAPDLILRAAAEAGGPGPAHLACLEQLVNRRLQGVRTTDYGPDDCIGARVMELDWRARRRMAPLHPGSVLAFRSDDLRRVERLAVDIEAGYFSEWADQEPTPPPTIRAVTQRAGSMLQRVDASLWRQAARLWAGGVLAEAEPERTWFYADQPIPLLASRKPCVALVCGIDPLPWCLDRYLALWQTLTRECAHAEFRLYAPAPVARPLRERGATVTTVSALSPLTAEFRHTRPHLILALDRPRDVPLANPYNTVRLEVYTHPGAVRGGYPAPRDTDIDLADEDATWMARLRRFLPVRPPLCSRDSEGRDACT